MKTLCTNSVAVHLAILRVASLLVPIQQREESFAEWRSELWYARQSCIRESPMVHGNVDVTAFCLGAFKDALWLRSNRSRGKVRDIFILDFPSRCLLLLAGLGAISLLIAFFLLGTRDLTQPFPHRDARNIVMISAGGDRNAQPANGVLEPSPVRAFVLITGFACLLVVATTPLSLGNYPANRHAPSLITRIRRWVFLTAKIGLILPIVYEGARYVAYFGAAARGGVGANFLLQALLWGCVLAFRWVLRDQRRRCPVCLRLLTNPVGVGHAAGCFLEWNFTELMCLQGHGLLYIPENPTSWFSVQRWLYLDSPWSSICSGARLP